MSTLWSTSRNVSYFFLKQSMSFILMEGKSCLRCGRYPELLIATVHTEAVKRGGGVRFFILASPDKIIKCMMNSKCFLAYKIG